MRPALRGYQQEGVDALRESYRAGRRAPIYALPTGGGKTLVFSHITDEVQRRNRRVLLLVHRAELLRQVSRSLDKWEVAHGCISPRTPMTDHPVQVASVQTAVRRLRSMMPPDLIIIDEAHHGVAASWAKIIEAFPNAKLLGVTATPSRLDGRGLGAHCGGFFDDIIVGPSIGSLINDGYLVRPRVFASPRHVNYEGLRSVAGEYNRADADRVMRQREIVGDAVDHYSRICPGVPAIAFCVTINAAVEVAAEFNRRGWRARRIDGAMSDDERQEVVADLTDGRIDVMVSVDLVSEGFDVPACGAAILLRPTQSTTLYLQQIGRALRPAPGKTCAFILDHAGNVGRHGMPQESREWTLDGMRRRDEAIGVHQCPQCFAMMPTTVDTCEECGYIWPAAGSNESGANSRDIERVDGELIELTPEIIAENQRRRAEEVRVARTREDLMRIARERGYNVRWVDHILNARQRRR